MQFFILLGALAKCSCEIFLIQMVIIPIIHQVNFVDNKYLDFCIRTPLVFVISIMGGYCFNKLYNNFMLKYFGSI